VSERASAVQGRAALERHAWRDAYEAFAVLDADGQLDAADLEALAEAAWWDALPAESIAAFERAFAAYVAASEPRRAAGVALRLCFEHADRLELALSNAWLQRAIRLLADEPDSVEHGYLELALIRATFDPDNTDEVMRHVTRVRELGTRFGDADLLAFALVIEGNILALRGRIDEGLALVDEGVLPAVSGELTAYMAGAIYCLTLGVCRSVADLRRAAEWTELAAKWCERQAITGFPGVCRVQRAEILRLRGAFAAAEDEATKALEDLTAFGRLPQAAAGSYEVGEIRRRVGDLDAAELAFERAHELGQSPHPGLALVLLARGRGRDARTAIMSAAAEELEPLERARVLAAWVEIALAEHDAGEAREAAGRLHELATAIPQPLLRATARHAQGVVLLAEDKIPEAIAELRKAVREWTDFDAPFEAAQARRSLAIAYHLSGDEASSELELRTARAAFERLGAATEVAACEVLQGERTTRVRRTFLFTDIVGSTDLIQTIGDEAWNDVLRWHDDTLRRQIASHRGEVVHATGDGFFASFPTAEESAACAVAIQRGLAQHRRKNGFAPQVRIGMHAAEATSVGGDYAGLGVHQAARVSSLAAGGEILITTETVDAAGPMPYVLTDERTVELKGIAHPVQVVAIDWKA
jgi:class 3 adenylate cyclase